MHIAFGGYGFAVVLLLLLVTPLLASFFSCVGGSRTPEAAALLSVLTVFFAFSCAVVLAIASAMGELPAASLTTKGGDVVLGVVADRTGVVLLLLVTGVSAIVQAFARRYLRGDPRAWVFFAGAGLLASATAAIVTSVTLVGVAVGWTAAGVAVVILLAMYPHIPAARDGVRRFARAFLVGDAALWAGVVLALVMWGNVDVRSIGDRIIASGAMQPLVQCVACVIVVAAVARSAGPPFHRWLPSTLAAPTPVSALLHAGVVNAGGILLIRLSPVFTASTIATSIAFSLGALAAVYGTAVMLTKPDVKGSLVYSTMGQMGFMIMTCGLGAFTAALFHLVAHAMYKSTLFLGSGSAIAAQRRLFAAPPSRTAGRARRVLVSSFAVVLALTAVAASAWALYPLTGSQDTPALLVFPAATAMTIAWTWMRSTATAASAIVATFLLLLGSASYVAAVAALGEFVGPSLPGSVGATLSPWLLSPVVLALLGATVLHRLPAVIHRAVYVRVMSAGHVRMHAYPPVPPRQSVDQLADWQRYPLGGGA
ncbi:MAG: proton-conducting transporter transmembrane domain-containing protein [Lacisediminihabitans sp.]